MAPGLSARYDAAAAHWGRRLDRLGFPAAYRSILRQVFQEVPPLPKGARAVDLGSGDGAFSEALLDVLGPDLSLTLVDAAPGMIAAAQDRLGARAQRYVVADVFCPISAAASDWDIVAAAHLIEHLPDLSGAMTRLTGLLAPGGVLILVVSRPHWCSRLVWFLWRHKRFTEAEMRLALAGAGLVDVQCRMMPAGPPRRLSLAYSARKPG
jgi:ubiquinone/menaquinone biosynthesis C-methylase UbiE